MRYTRISADCHVDLCWLPPDLFTSSASAAMKDRMPYVTDGPTGPVWVTKKGAKLGLMNGMGSAGREYVPGKIHRSDRMAATGLYEDGKRGIRRLTDPELRLKDQERDGVQAEVLYGILGATRRLNDPEAAVELVRIYNEWLAGFCDAHPDRYAGLACIPNSPVEAAVEEMRRVIKRGGVRGLEIAHSHDIVPLWDPQWNPVWEVANEVALPVHFHTVGERRPDLAKLPPATRASGARGSHLRLPTIHGHNVDISDLRRRARALAQRQDRDRRERDRLDPLRAGPHGRGVGGPIQGLEPYYAAERVLASTVPGDLPERSHRHQAPRRPGARYHHVGFRLPPPGRGVARLERIHRARTRPPARGGAPQARLRERRQAVRVRCIAEGQRLLMVQVVQIVPIVQTLRSVQFPLLHPPPRRGGGKR